MSTHPEKLTPTRKWMKPLMVAVPLVMVSGFVYTSCQFTELDLSFIPKDAEINGYCSDSLKSRLSPPSTNPLMEVTRFGWAVKDPKDINFYEKELLARGFKRINPLDSFRFRRYIRSDGNYLMLQMRGSGYGENWARLRIEHEVTRPGPRMVKEILLWMERLI